MTQLNLPEGIRQRDAGVKRVTTNNAEWVRWMRKQAKQDAYLLGGVHIDQLRAYAKALDYYPDSPNAWGAIFREKGWRKTGEYRASKVASNHGHVSPVWEWKP
jgi:hypothetical protein